MAYCAMCGIAGLICSKGRVVPPGLARRLSDTLAHRGPDGEGFLEWDGDSTRLVRQPTCFDKNRIAFIHRRLKIIDLSDGGWQPMASEDRQVSIIFNGEIYNYVELRSELTAMGFEFASTSDTEVLLKGYLAWGKALFARLLGMFAIAILDLRERRVHLVRDQFGMKPIVYAHTSDGFAFASEINALLEIPGWDRQLEPESVFRYLRWGCCTEDRSTLLKRVERVLPGELLSVDIDDPTSLRSERYWQLASVDCTPQNLENAAESLLKLLEETVRIHLRSDVPIGIALSGGIDSTTLALLSRQCCADLSLTAFSYLPGAKELNEETLIRLVASRADIHVEPVILDPARFFCVADEAARAMDEPFGTPSVIAESEVFRKAREKGVPVIFSGQGPDEIMAGYERYRPLAIVSQMRSGRFDLAFKQFWASSKWPDSPARLVAGWIAVMTMPLAIQRLGRSAFGKQLVPKGAKVAWFRANGVEPREAGAVTSVRNLKERLRYDSFNFGLQNLLAWADQTSMQHSVECRLPYLNPKIAELVAGLPDEYLLAIDGTCKEVLRVAAKEFVPQEILRARRKIGFETDTDHLLSASVPWIKSITENGWFAKMPFVEMQEIRNQVQAIEAGNPIDFDQFWRFLNFSLWSEERNLAF